MLICMYYLALMKISLRLIVLCLYAVLCLYVVVPGCWKLLALADLSQFGQRHAPAMNVKHR